MASQMHRRAYTPHQNMHRRPALLHTRCNSGRQSPLARCCAVVAHHCTRPCAQSRPTALMPRTSRGGRTCRHSGGQLAWQLGRRHAPQLLQQVHLVCLFAAFKACMNDREAIPHSQTLGHCSMRRGCLDDRLDLVLDAADEVILELCDWSSTNSSVAAAATTARHT